MNENSIPTSDVLYRAADLIEERGWVQGSEGWTLNLVGGLCMEGGIQVAAGLRWADDVPWCPAAQAMLQYLGAENCMSPSWGDARLYIWNDAANRTATEVIEVLRAAALLEAAKESADERVAVTV